MERSCLSCEDLFPHLSNVKNHQYCKKVGCQRARKALWQRLKMGRDEAYRENQRKAQCAWKEKKPRYWREYRANHEAYREREKQRQYRRRHPLGPSIAAQVPPAQESSLRPADVAKMDATIPIKSGTYRIEPVFATGCVAKMDTMVVQLVVIEEDARPQERTCTCQVDFFDTLYPQRIGALCPATNRKQRQHHGDSG